MERVKVLFVCHGNICRSPMAEFVLKHLVNRRGLSPMFDIASAATSTEEIGRAVYPPARDELMRHGIDCSGHKARRMTAEDYARFDYVLAADEENLRNIVRLAGAAACGKERLLMSFAGVERGIADPWYTGDFSTTYDDVLAGCEAFLEKMVQDAR